MNSRLKICLCLVGLLLSSFQSSQHGDLTVIASGIRNSNGEVNFNLFNRADGFPSEVSNALQHLRGKISNGTSSVIFKNIPFGKYAIAVYHDENNDSKLNKSWYGRPTEGVGISNNAKGHFAPPTFGQAKFDFNAQSKTQLITINYTFEP
ncbi:MAG TPA: DUF2141 domain-containing protein [Cyclobacteriaceae bacterium]|nr:DUF2141 domain-containing protein [Cyclobacteriaceae bacterium]